MIKLLMGLSAAFMAMAGIALSFMAQELFALQGGSVTLLLAQMMGALYLGFALLNWMAKGTIIGGVFGRPVAFGNLAHFLIGALAILKVTSGNPAPWVWPAAVLYTAFALAFGLVVFRHPAIATCG